MRIIAAVCIGVMLGLLSFSDVSAQETQLVVTPAIIDAPAFPGESTTRTIQITNTNDTALPISFAVQSAVIDGEPIEDEMSERYDVSDWINFEENTYIFEAGQTREIEFTITPPFTALAGGHYAQISIRGLALEQTDIAQGLVFPEIGVPILITVPGEIIEDARFTGDSLFPRFVRRGQEIAIEVPVENLGTVHNLVALRLVLQKDGETVFVQNLTPGIILPATRKTFQGSWAAPEYGEYDAYAELTFGNDQKLVQSEPEAIAVTPSLSSILWLAILVWTGSYLWPRRGNIT